MKGAGSGSLWSIREQPAPSSSAIRLQSISRHGSLHSIASPAGGRPPPPQRGRPLDTDPAPALQPRVQQRRLAAPVSFLGDSSGAGKADAAAAVLPGGPGLDRSPGAADAGRGWLVLGSMASADGGARGGVLGLIEDDLDGAAASDSREALAAAGRVVAELHAAARAARGAAPGAAAATAAAAAEWRSSVKLLRPQLRGLSPDQLADLAWALSRLGLRPGAGWTNDLLAAAAAAFDQRRFRGYTFATLLPALPALGARPGARWTAACLGALALKSPAMWPRELASIAAALPPLLRALPPPSSRTGRGAGGENAGAAALLAESGWAGAFFESSRRQLRAFEPVALARSFHAAAQLSAELGVEVPSGWRAEVASRLEGAAAEGKLLPQEVAMALTALALLQSSGTGSSSSNSSSSGINSSSSNGGALAPADAALQAALERALVAAAPRFGPQELSSSLLALANLGARPGWPWLQAVLHASEAQLPRCGPRQLSTLVSAVARLVRACPEAQPQAWDQALTVLQDARRMEQLQKQQQAAARGGDRRGAGRAAPAAGDPAAPGGAAARGAVVRWAQACCAAALPQLQAFGAEDVAATAAALASLCVVPPPLWYEALLRAARARIVAPLEAAAEAAPAAGGGEGDGESSGQVAAAAASRAARVAAALSRLSLLPSPSDTAVALLPSGPWLQQLYDAVAAADAAGRPREASSPWWQQQQQQQQEEEGERVVEARQPAGSGGGCVATQDVVTLMWAAAAFGWCPGERWWGWAEGLLLARLAGAPGAGGGAAAAALPPLSALSLVQAYAGARRRMPPALLCAGVLSRPAADWAAGGGGGGAARLVRALARLPRPQPPSGAGEQAPGRRGSEGGGLAEVEGDGAELRCFVSALAAALQPRMASLSAPALAALAGVLARSRLFDARTVPGWGNAFLAAAQQHMAAAPPPAQGATRAAAPPQRPGGAPAASAAPAAPAAPAAGGVGAGCRPREAAALLASAVRLGLRPPGPWVAAALRQLELGFPDASPRALAAAIGALAELNFRPPADWVGSFLLASQRKLPDSDARSLLATVCALARLGARPGARWLRPALVALHARLPALPPRGRARLLAALASMGVRPSHAYVSRVVAALLPPVGEVNGSDGGSGNSAGAPPAEEEGARDEASGAASRRGRTQADADALLVNALCSAATLGWQPDADWVARHAPALWRAAARRAPALSDAMFVQLLQATAALAPRAPPPAAWRGAVARGLLARAPALPAAALGRAGWAAGRLRLPLAPAAPPAPRGSAPSAAASDGADPHISNFCEAEAAAHALLLGRAAQVWDDWRAPHLVQFLTGAARLGLRPPQAWLAAAAAAPCLSPPSALGGERLVLLLAALARLGYTPPAAWAERMDTVLQASYLEGPAMAAAGRWALAALRGEPGAAPRAGAGGPGAARGRAAAGAPAAAGRRRE